VLPVSLCSFLQLPTEDQATWWCCSLGVVVDSGAPSAGEAVGDRRRQRRMTQLEMHAAGVKFVT
jgi:hypothetical protein